MQNLSYVKTFHVNYTFNSGVTETKFWRTVVKWIYYAVGISGELHVCNEFRVRHAKTAETFFLRVAQIQLWQRMDDSYCHQSGNERNKLWQYYKV